MIMKETTRVSIQGNIAEPDSTQVSNVNVTTSVLNSTLWICERPEGLQG